MREYSIVTDAAADIPQDIIEKGFGVTVIPIAIKMKYDKFLHYHDFRNLASEEFYPMVRMGALPVTEPVSVESYTEVFEDKLKKDRDVIYIGISGGLSESLSAAGEAAEKLKERYPSGRISIIDSRNASTGLGLLVIEAIRLKESNISYDEAVTRLLEKRDKVRNYFFVDDTVYLRRSGKVPKTEQSAAAALKIKTLFKVDDEGRLEIMTKVRGIPNALDVLFEKYTGEAAGDSVINIASAAGGDRAQKLKELITQYLAEKDSREKVIGEKIYTSDMSLVSGTHSGPGTVAIAYFADAAV